MRNIAVCLLSGGLDSCTAATLAKQAGDELYFLTINWNQTNAIELKNAKKISKILKPKEHKFVNLKAYNQLSQSALTGHKEIPNDRNLKKNISEMPVTYPPGRDPTFIFIASSWLESIILNYLSEGEKVDSGKVIIGTNKQDSLAYPDCNPKIYELLNQMFSISTKASKENKIPLRVETPLIKLTKKEVLGLGHRIGAPIKYTWSCYKGGNALCGECDPCRIVYFAFKDLGIKNPFAYQKIPGKRY